MTRATRSTYVSRGYQATGDLRRYLGAMMYLGNGLLDGDHTEEALSVKEAQLSLCLRHPCVSEKHILDVKSMLAGTNKELGRLEKALQMQQDVYAQNKKLHGEEHRYTLSEGYNYSTILLDLQRFEEAKSLLRKTIPVARRVSGESEGLLLKMRWNYAEVLYQDPDATLDDLREAVKTLEETARIARRVFGDAHPLTTQLEQALRDAQAALSARETQSSH